MKVMALGSTFIVHYIHVRYISSVCHDMSCPQDFLTTSMTNPSVEKGMIHFAWSMH